MKYSETVIQDTTKMVEGILEGEGSGHDFEHIRRVWQMAIDIIDTEPKADKFVVSMAILLHDLIDDKLTMNTADSLQKLSIYLDDKEIEAVDKEHILEIIQTMSFREKQTANSLEGQIVQDADRLDAMGAIGIARAFTYGGSIGQPILAQTSKGSTVDHFYEKLLKLKDTMTTQKGKEIAERRHRFMLLYIEELKKEVNGYWIN